MMGEFIEITNAIVEIFILLFFFSQMLNKKEQKVYYKVSVIAVILMAHVGRSFLLIDTYENIGITCVLWAVLLWLLYEGTFLKKSIIFVLYFVAVFIADMLCRYIMMYLIDSTYGAHAATPGLERYIGMVLISVLIFVMLFIFIMVSKNKSSDLNIKYRIIMIFFPIFSLFIVVCTDIFIMLSGVGELKYIIPLFIIIIGLLFFNIMTFEFMDTYSAKLRLAAAEELIKNQEESYQLLEINEKELRKLRHNINEHMEVMKEMIKYNTDRESIELSRSLQTLASLPISVVYTGDIALDAILNVEARKASNYGITYLVKTQNLIQPIIIPAIDKSTILCNAINNAIEACQKLERDERFVVIDIYSKDNIVKIIIENSSMEQKVHNHRIHTSKSDGKNHGFGIESIKKSVQKYQGDFRISYSEGVMTCIIQFNNINSR